MTLTAATQRINVLRGISLTIARGESVSIVGPSGAGKSTLMMITAGLTRATSGNVTIAGEQLTRMNEDALARFRQKHVGIVFQSFRLVPTMTARENVALPLELARDHDAFAKADEALAAVGLKERVHHRPDQLSGGEQQRVALARAVVARPSLLLADEPTGNLDESTGHRIVELLFALQKQHGMTLVIVTHDNELAAKCDRAISMRDGALA